MRLLELVVTAVTITTVCALPRKLNAAGQQGEISVSARLKREPSSGLEDHHPSSQIRTTVKPRIERRAENVPGEPIQPLGPHSPLPDARTREQLQEMSDIIMELIEGISLPIARCMSNKVWNLKLQGRNFDIHDLHKFRVECEESFARKLSDAGLWDNEVWGWEDETPRRNGNPSDGGNRPSNGGQNNGPFSLNLGAIHPKQAIQGTLNTIGGKVNAFNAKVNAAIRAHNPAGPQGIKPVGGFPAGALPAGPLPI
ncbi:MAG: hypothetical protein M1816_001793 [Peltula sp. TS41687]|nr:MAG: hypothetical protein M1816_001793 [Peltula sp. TS41687]